MELTQGLGGLELNTLFFSLGQLRLNKGQADFGSLLVNGSVVEERPLDESDQLALHDWRVQLLLSQAEQ